MSYEGSRHSVFIGKTIIEIEPCTFYRKRPISCYARVQLFLHPYLKFHMLARFRVSSVVHYFSFIELEQLAYRAKNEVLLSRNRSIRLVWHTNYKIWVYINVATQHMLKQVFVHLSLIHNEASKCRIKRVLTWFLLMSHANWDNH